MTVNKESEKRWPHVSVDEAIDALSDAALICRDLSHAWQPHTARRISGGFERVLRCRVCDTLRREDLNSFGAVIENSRRYTYPEGYRVEGVGRFTGSYKDRARLTNMVKRIEQQEEFAAQQEAKVKAKADKATKKEEKVVPKKETTKKKPVKKKKAA